MKDTRDKQKMSRLVHWWYCHMRAFFNSLGEVIRAPFSSLMTFLVIGIAMAFPSGLYLLLHNLKALSQTWQGNPTLSLYLKVNTSDEQITNILTTVRSNPIVESARYISPEQGLQEFEQATQFKQILSGLNKNPIPPVIVVTPYPQADTPAQLKLLQSTLSQLPQVALTQLDMDWVKRLFAFVTLGQRLTYALGMLFGLGVILIVGNTIRLITQNQRTQIQVLKLVGATDAFVRRPFLYRGALYGAGGGLVAWLMIRSVLWWIHPPFAHLASAYQQTLTFHGFDLVAGSMMILCSALLGLLGAWLALSRYLQT